MKVLIIEDEPRAARQLENMIKMSIQHYELIGVIDSVEEAVQWFRSYEEPDLVFMDIQLADGLSFEIFQNVVVDAPIIFTTAFDQYAIQAFKVNSIDYLLKPIQQDDLDRAIKKLQKSSQENVLDPSILSKLISSITTKKRAGILVKEGKGFVQIKVEDLLYAYSEDSITFGVTEEKRFIIDETVDQFFETLDVQQFFRINRGQIISKKAIEKISPYLNHRMKISIRQPRDLEFVVSRKRTSEFKEWLNR